MKNLQFIELEKIKYPLVNQFYKQVYKKGVASKNESVFILWQKEIICSAKLKKLDDHLLLTGVACQPEFRGQGYASQLISNLLSLQEQAVYCFPYAHLELFYRKLGFVTLDTNDSPEIIQIRFNKYRQNRELLLMVHSISSK